MRRSKTESNTAHLILDSLSDVPSGKVRAYSSYAKGRGFELEGATVSQVIASPTKLHHFLFPCWFPGPRVKLGLIVLRMEPEVMGLHGVGTNIHLVSWGLFQLCRSGDEEREVGMQIRNWTDSSCHMVNTTH